MKFGSVEGGDYGNHDGIGLVEISNISTIHAMFPLEKIYSTQNTSTTTTITDSSSMPHHKLLQIQRPPTQRKQKYEELILLSYLKQRVKWVTKQLTILE